MRPKQYPWSLAFVDFINASKVYISFTDKTTLIRDFSDEDMAKAVINRDLEYYSRNGLHHGNCTAVQPTENIVCSFSSKN